jgi:hypothetical protein
MNAREKGAYALEEHVQAKVGCSTFIVFRRWGVRPNERV